jgi:hypothetical protein
MADIDFEVGLLPAALTLSELTHAYTPLPGLRSTGVFVSAYLTGASGNRYHGQRAFGDTHPDRTRVFSFCRLQDGVRDRRPPELWSDQGLGELRPYRYQEGTDTVTFSNNDCRVEVSEGSWHWQDAGGRWVVEAEVLGDRGYYFWVPTQEQAPVCQYHRGQNFRLQGEIDGERVHGAGYLEYSWGPKDIDFQFFELPLLRRMNKAWMWWYADLADGGYCTGAARKGRAGVNWSMAYLVNDGHAKVLHPVATDLTYDENGMIAAAQLNTAQEVVYFDQDCTSYYPIHTIGRVKEVSGRAPVTESWVNMEWMPDNAEQFWRAYNEGRITAREVPQMRIAGERFVIPGVLD